MSKNNQASNLTSKDLTDPNSFLIKYRLNLLLEVSLVAEQFLASMVAEIVIVDALLAVELICKLRDLMKFSKSMLSH